MVITCDRCGKPVLVSSYTYRTGSLMGDFVGHLICHILDEKEKV